MVWLFDVVIDLYIVVAVGISSRKILTSLYPRLPPDDDLLMLTDMTVSTFHYEVY